MASSDSLTVASPGANPAALPLTPQRSRHVDVDLQALGARGFLCPGGAPTLLTDQFRVVKRPLINNALGRGVHKADRGNLIMITSALPGEGKTFTAVNLALSIAAEVDSTVLLVDADVANPSVQDALGIEPDVGLLDVLTGHCSVRDAILRTNIDKLTVMAAGTPQDRATEMLGSAAMANLLHEMASRYTDRIIVFDLPPLLLTTEARVMASHAGQLVVVVRSHQTTESELRDALATVDSVALKMVMLNQATSTDHAEYGYGYGYRRYYRDKTRRSGGARPKAAPEAMAPGGLEPRGSGAGSTRSQPAWKVNSEAG
jgi:protein-tyrosine kinase